MTEEYADLDDLLRPASGPTDWRTVPDYDAEQVWAELHEWVDWLVERYQLDHRVVPPCWDLHTALVDVLTALWDFHTHAFQSMSPPTAAVDWHRVFRELEDRLREWASRTGCTRGTHRADVSPSAP